MSKHRQFVAAPLGWRKVSLLGVQEGGFTYPADGRETVKKGMKVVVDGKLDISEYTDKYGQKRTSFRILADAYRLL